MKKNDFAIFLVYVGMFAIGLLTAFLAVRPVLMAHANNLPIHFVALVIIALLSGILINSLIMEFGHWLGAKAGQYTVYSWTVLGLKWFKKGGKTKFKLSGFDGLTGETKIAPKDVEKSSLGAYIMFPLLGFFIEVIVCVIFIVISKTRVNEGHPGDAWIQVFCQVVLAIGGMLLLYDIVPFRLDSITDGYLLSVTNKPINKIAYNQLLDQSFASYEGRESEPLPLYEEITDFTARLNITGAYRLCKEGSYKEAVVAMENIIATENRISSSLRHEATVMKLSLLFLMDVNKAKKVYEDIDDGAKKYISNLESMSALRAYILISGFVEDSQTEAEFALGKEEKVLKDYEKNDAEAEIALVEKTLEIVNQEHPGWKLSREVEEPKEKQE